MQVKLITFSKIVAHFLRTQNLKFSLKNCFSVYKITYLWNSSLSINCLHLWNIYSVYKMSCLWEVPSIKCPIMNLFFYEMTQHPQSKRIEYILERNLNNLSVWIFSVPFTLKGSSKCTKQMFTNYMQQSTLIQYVP